MLCACLLVVSHLVYHRLSKLRACIKMLTSMYVLYDHVVPFEGQTYLVYVARGVDMSMTCRHDTLLVNNTSVVVARASHSPLVVTYLKKTC